MNIYYNPEKFGLTLVKDVEWRDESYEFDQTVLWKDEAGQFYAASDSGCSCPTPFENLGLGDLTKINSLQDLLAYIDKTLAEGYYNGYDIEGSKADLVDAYRRARG